MPERSSDSIGLPRTRGRDETRPRVQESIETLQAFGYGITEPDDRNIVIRDVKTISWLYPTEYAAVLGPSRLRPWWSDRGGARGMRRGAVSPTEGRGCSPLPVRNQPSEAFG